MYDNFIDDINARLETAPDKLYALPTWMGTFKKEFEKQSGVELDVDRFIDDSDYRLSNKEAVRKSRLKADESITDSLGTLNPYEGIAMTQLNKRDATNIYKSFRVLFMRFQLTEYSSIVKGINAAMGKHEMSRAEGSRLALSAGAKMSFYNIALRSVEDFFMQQLFSLFGIDIPDKEEEESMMYNIIRGISSGVAAPLLMGRLDNFQKILPSFGLEYLNSEFGEGITRDVGAEYDSYKNGVLPSVLMMNAERPSDIDSAITEAILSSTGSMSGIAKTTYDMAKHVYVGGVKNPFNDAYIVDPISQEIKYRKQAYYIAKNRQYNRDRTRFDFSNILTYSIPLPAPRAIRKMASTYTFKDMRKNRNEEQKKFNDKVIEALNRDIQKLINIKDYK